MRRWEALVRQSPNGGYISTCVLFWPEACISPLFLGVAIVAILYLGGGLKPALFRAFLVHFPCCFEAGATDF